MDHKAAKSAVKKAMARIDALNKLSAKATRLSRDIRHQRPSSSRVSILSGGASSNRRPTRTCAQVGNRSKMKPPTGARRWFTPSTKNGSRFSVPVSYVPPPPISRWRNEHGPEAQCSRGSPPLRQSPPRRSREAAAERFTPEIGSRGGRLPRRRNGLRLRGFRRKA